MSPPIQVLIADDQKLFRQSLHALLDQHPTIHVIGAAANGQDAVQLATELFPQVVLMDLSMPGLDGLQAIRLIVQRRPQIKVIVLTSYRDSLLVVQAFRAGAAAYVLKEVEDQDLTRIIEGVVAGKPVSSPFMATASSMTFDKDGRKASPAGPAYQLPSTLTKPEEALGHLVLNGMFDEDIAEALGTSQDTIKARLASLYQKLGVQDRVALYLKCVR